MMPCTNTVGNFRFDTTEECDTVTMNRRLNEAVGQILKLNREKKYGEKDSCQEDGRAPVV
jgi:hypothetical protein